jgi:hypothetical protein
MGTVLSFYELILAQIQVQKFKEKYLIIASLYSRKLNSAHEEFNEIYW